MTTELWNLRNATSLTIIAARTRNEEAIDKALQAERNRADEEIEALSKRVAEFERVMRVILHSAEQALIPGNDARREAQLQKNIATEYLGENK